MIGSTLNHCVRTVSINEGVWSPHWTSEIQWARKDCEVRLDLGLPLLVAEMHPFPRDGSTFRLKGLASFLPVCPGEPWRLWL